MKQWYRNKYVFTLAMLISFQFARGYESLFIVGSEVLWKDGLKYQLNTEVDRAGQYTQINFDNIWEYGVTRDLTLEFILPIVMTTEQFTLTPAFLPSPIGTMHTPSGNVLVANILSRNRSAGIGDMEFLIKYRLFEHTSLGKELELTLISGFKFPTGKLCKNRPNNAFCATTPGCVEPCAGLSTGTKTFDFLEYLAFSYNSRPWFILGTAGFNIRTKHHGSRPGNEFTLSIAGGPRLMEAAAFTMPDFILMPELDLVYTFSGAGCNIPQTRGTTVWLGPTIFYSQAFLITKFGIQWPVTQHCSNLKKQDYRLAGGFDFYF